MIKTLQYMLTELRQFSGQNRNRSSIDDDVMVSLLDTAQDKIVDTMIANDPYLFSNYYDLTLDGSERYYLPDYLPFDYFSIVQVTEVSSGEEYKTVHTVWGDRLFYTNQNVYTFNSAWSIRDQYIEFPQKPASGTIRIWYTRRPKGFFYATASAGSTTTATIGTAATFGQIIPTDDYYIGMKVARESTYEVSRITDFDAFTTSSTHTVTFSPAFNTVVASTNVISIVSPLPDRYVQLIIDDAIRRIKVGHNDDDTQYARMNNENEDKMRQGLNNLTQYPEYVAKVPRM